MDLKSTYDKIAKLWMDDHAKDTWWVESVDKFVSLVPQGGTILDVGCGVGQKSKYFTDKGFKVVAFDFSEEMVKLARSKVPEAEFFVKDIKEPLNFDMSFDGVFAQAVLLHIPKKEIPQIIKNIIAPLKPGEHLYIAVKGVIPGKPDEQILKENDYGFEYERFFSYFTQEEMENYLKQAGLNIVYNLNTLNGKTNWIQIIAQKN